MPPMIAPMLELGFSFSTTSFVRVSLVACDVVVDGTSVCDVDDGGEVVTLVVGGVAQNSLMSHVQIFGARAQDKQLEPKEAICVCRVLRRDSCQQSTEGSGLSHQFSKDGGIGGTSPVKKLPCNVSVRNAVMFEKPDGMLP
jgi:hypothetical protein